MLKKLTIEGFRGLHDVELADLGLVNILIGPNGTGKTSILEAASIAANPLAPPWLNNLGIWREMPPLQLGSDDSLRSVFPNMDLGATVEIGFENGAGKHCVNIKPTTGLNGAGTTVEVIATDESPLPASLPLEQQLLGATTEYVHPTKGKAAMQMQLVPTGGHAQITPERPPDTLGCFYIQARRSTSAVDTSRVLTHLYETNAEEPFLDAIRQIDERVRRIVPGLRNNQPIVLVDVGLPRMIPINLLGDGLCRVALMLTGIVSKSALLIVDEIDSGLHHSVMKKFWRSLIHLSKKHDFQLICTTHNEEMLHHAVQAFTEKPDALVAYRLQARPEKEEPVRRLTHDLLRDADLAGMEMR